LRKNLLAGEKAIIHATVVLQHNCCMQHIRCMQQFLTLFLIPSMHFSPLHLAQSGNSIAEPRKVPIPALTVVAAICTRSATGRRRRRRYTPPGSEIGITSQEKRLWGKRALQAQGNLGTKKQERATNKKDRSVLHMHCISLQFFRLEISGRSHKGMGEDR